MLRYLHLQARPVIRNFAAQMLQHGIYDLVQNVQQQQKSSRLDSHPHFIPTLLPTGPTAPIVLLGMVVARAHSKAFSYQPHDPCHVSCR
jgi:hypothetical protein